MNLFLAFLILFACWWPVWDAYHQQPAPFALQYEARP